MKCVKAKDPHYLLTLALKPGAERHPEFGNENDVSKATVDLVGRLRRLAKMPCVWTHMTFMPSTGRGALREIRKLTRGNEAERNDQLRSMLERGTINPRTRRTDIDNIHSAYKKKIGRTEVAPRHRGQRT